MNSAFHSMSVFTETMRYLKLASHPRSDVHYLKQKWALDVLHLLKTNLQVINKVQMGRASIFVGNHLSYLDIPLLMAVDGQISFVAKQEVSRWPVIGKAAKKIETVFVKRNDPQSKLNARIAIKEAIMQGKKICIFPSGTTTLHEEIGWKKGVFEIAKDLNLKVQPFRITYSDTRLAAYVDKDTLLLHLYKLVSSQGLQATIEFGDVIEILDPSTDAEQLRLWTQNWTS